MENFLFQLYGLIDMDFSNLGHQDGRRALIYFLGNNNNAIIATDILIYLIYQTYTTPQDLLEEYNGFIVRSYQQIEIYTGCSNLKKHKRPLDLLKEEGLIETHNNSIQRRTCFKVNTEVLIEKLDEAYMAIGKLRDDFWEKYKENKKTEYRDPVDWEKMSEYLEEGEGGIPKGYDTLIGKKISPFDIHMMYWVQKIWKESYGEDYKWTRGEFNTLSNYFTANGVKQMTTEELDKMKESIQTIDEVSWLTKAYTARKIIFRMRGYKRFKK